MDRAWTFEAIRERVVDVVYTLGWVVGVLGLLALIGSGCSERYVVIASDREVVPVKAIDGGTSYKRTADGAEDATGWYVPDAVMVDLLK